jgi:hypothetical protein
MEHHANRSYPRPFIRPQDSVFWTEHNYGPNTPYFSYLHRLGNRGASQLDALIGYLHDQAIKHFPAAKKAKYWFDARKV